MSTPERVSEFLGKINATYKANIVGFSSAKAYDVSRFSSGVLPIDVAIGGGWPFGRLGIIAGNESTGKTLLALKAAASVSNYDRETRKHRSEVDPSKFTPCTALFVDVEGTFDAKWACANGWDDATNVIARTDYAEQAIDIVDFAIRDNTFDLIILDSIAALTPTKEITESAEDWQMGLAARLVNKAMRKWSASLNKTSQIHSTGGPFVLCLNQIREKVGVIYGDPRVLPCGKGQLFASSIIVWTKSAKILDDAESKESAFITMGGVVKKNKTWVPGNEFAYQMALTESENYSVGEVDNDCSIVKLGKKYGVLNRDGGFGCIEFRAKTEDVFIERLREDPALTSLLYKRIVEAALK